MILPSVREWTLSMSCEKQKQRVKCVNTPYFAVADLKKGGGGIRGIRSKPLNKNNKHCNTLTWTQNSGNQYSEDHNFKNLQGGCPRTPLQGTAFGVLYLETLSLKSCIRPTFALSACSFSHTHYNVNLDVQLNLQRIVHNTQLTFTI